MESQTILEQLEALSPEERQAVETVIKSLARKANVAKVAAERRAAFGAAKGVVTWMSPDFNEPLEDFKESV